MVNSSDVAVQELVIDQLAYARGRSRDHIMALIEAAGGDLEMDSKEGETVAARAEVVLGLPEPIRTERQDRRELTSVSSLTRLIERRRAQAQAAPGGGV